eukprot:4085078-Amphidinium_carterae.1
MPPECTSATMLVTKWISFEPFECLCNAYTKLFVTSTDLSRSSQLRRGDDQAILGTVIPSQRHNGPSNDLPVDTIWIQFAPQPGL